MSEATNEAREILDRFTIGLEALNVTNQQLLHVQAKRAQQEEQLLYYYGYLIRQIGDLAQRIDGLDGQLAALSQILVEDDVRLPPVLPAPPIASRPGRPFQVPTPGQMLGGVVGYGVDQLFPGGFPGGGGRGRPR